MANDYFSSKNKIRRIMNFKKRLKKEVRVYDTEVGDWIIDNYNNHGILINRIITNLLKKDMLFLLYYSDESFKHCANTCYNTLISKHPFIDKKEELIYLFIKNYHQNVTNKRVIPDFHLNKEITNWIKTTHENYNVNLLAFAHDYLMKFSENTEIWYEDHKIYNKNTTIINYNYRTNNNKFNIDDLFMNVSDMPFLDNRKKLIELIFLHEWLTSFEHDYEFWNEYYKGFYQIP